MNSDKQQSFEQQFLNLNYYDLKYISTPKNNGISIYMNQKNNKIYKYNLFTNIWVEEIVL